MNIGVDMDGVIISNHEAWKEYFNSNHDAHSHRFWLSGSPKTWNYWSKACGTCFGTCVSSPSILLNCPLVPGASKGLRQLATMGELHLVSHRPPDLRSTALDLLERLGVSQYFTSFHWSMDSKLATCLEKNISLLIDDGPKNAEELKGSPVQCILLSYPYNEPVEGITRCRSWDDIVKAVKESTLAPCV